MLLGDSYRTEIARPPLASVAVASTPTSSPMIDRANSVAEARPRRCAAVGGAKYRRMCAFDERAFSRIVVALQIAQYSMIINFSTRVVASRCELGAVHLSEGAIAVIWLPIATKAKLYCNRFASASSVVHFEVDLLGEAHNLTPCGTSRKCELIAVPQLVCHGRREPAAGRDQRAEVP